MSRRRRRSNGTASIAGVNGAEAKAVAALTPADVPVSPDSLHDQGVSWVGTAEDPYLLFQRETDIFRRRAMCYSLCLRCSVTSALMNNFAADLSAQQVYIVPTVTNPSATDMAIMRHTVALLNSWQMSPTGVYDAMRNLVGGYLTSNTGAFIAMPRSGGVVQGLFVLPPLIVFPLYGHTERGEPVVSPNSRDALDRWGNPIEDASVQGVYYTDIGIASSRYFELDQDEYYQLAPGAFGYGAFKTTRSRGEDALGQICEMISLDDYRRGVIGLTDEAQVFLWNNVQSAQLKEYSEKRKKLREMKRRGQPIPVEDEGLRLHVVNQNTAGRDATVKAINLRTFAEGFDPDKAARALSATICVRWGFNDRRATADVMTERFGNSTNAAILNNDEPTAREISVTFERFVSGVLLGGVPAIAQLVAESSPENYAVVQRDQVVAQTLSQSDWMTPETKQAYALRQGMLQPSEVGAEAFRTGQAGPKETLTFAKSFATLADRNRQPYVWEPPIIVMPVLNGRKAFDVEECTRLATARYEDWITNELPTVIQGNRMDRSILTDEVDDIANDVWSQVVRCYRSETGNNQSPQVREILNYNRAAWLNAIASPEARPPVPTERRPENNLWSNLWNQAGRVALGDATAATLQTSAAFFTPYIARYMNAIRAGVYASEWQGKGGPVTWKRNARESCGDCIRYEGVYPSYDAMLRRTRGLVPGDLRLTCSGNCLCELVES